LTRTNKASFERSYKIEKDAKVMERMLLVLNVVIHDQVAAHAAIDLHRN
jgi:hypothetical protein